MYHVHQLDQITCFQVALQTLPISCVHESGSGIGEAICALVQNSVALSRISLNQHIRRCLHGLKETALLAELQQSCT